MNRQGVVFYLSALVHVLVVVPGIRHATFHLVVVEKLAVLVEKLGCVDVDRTVDQQLFGLR